MNLLPLTIIRRSDAIATTNINSGRYDSEHIFSDSSIKLTKRPYILYYFEFTVKF